MQIYDINLEAIPLEDVLIHERTIPDGVDFLKRKIEKHGFLKNPVIVVREKDRYVVIDGNHRVEALKSISARTIIAQIIDYSEVRIEAWNRIIETDLSTLRNLFPIGERGEGSDCWIAYRGKSYEVDLDRTTAIDMLEKLKERFKIGFTPHTSSPYPVFCYRPFTREEIIENAMKFSPLPPKSTRHILPRRVLGVRFPLEKLLNEDAEECERFLQELVRLRQREGSVREYPERILMLDEYE